MTKRNAFYAQSGGVTAVINAQRCGVIETARAQPARDRPACYAGRNGIIGALTEDLIDTEQGIGARRSPRCAHAGRRVRLVPLQAQGPRREPRAVRAADRGVPRARHRLLLLQRRQRFGRHLPQGVAGRGDARLSAHRRPRAEDRRQRPAVTDCCPGFGSVAKYVATSMREAAFDVASMAKTSTKVFVLEVMGRHAGWIAAAGGLAEDAATPIPLVLLFPEIRFDEAKFIARVEARVEALRLLLRRRLRRPAERRRQVPGRSRARKDAFGHAQLGGVGPLIAQAGQGAARLQVSLGRGRLPAARRAPPRVEDRPRPGVRGRQGGRRARARRARTR